MHTRLAGFCRNAVTRAFVQGRLLVQVGQGAGGTSQQRESGQAGSRVSRVLTTAAPLCEAFGSGTSVCCTAPAGPVAHSKALPAKIRLMFMQRK